MAQAAIDYCTALAYGGESDWRLPDNDVLSGLINSGRSEPESEFPRMASSGLWTSVSYAGDTGGAWRAQLRRLQR